jgi:hypothetical protein
VTFEREGVGELSGVGLEGEDLDLSVGAGEGKDWNCTRNKERQSDRAQSGIVEWIGANSRYPGSAKWRGRGGSCSLWKWFGGAWALKTTTLKNIRVFS